MFFRATGMIFPRFDGIWRHMGAIFCNWKWIKWFRRIFKKKLKFFYGRYWPRPTDHFAGVYGRRRDRTRLLAGPGVGSFQFRHILEMKSLLLLQITVTYWSICKRLSSSFLSMTKKTCVFLCDNCPCVHSAMMYWWCKKQFHHPLLTDSVSDRNLPSSLVFIRDSLYSDGWIMFCHNHLPEACLNLLCR
jgi:hypothetical protein